MMSLLFAAAMTVPMGAGGVPILDGRCPTREWRDAAHTDLGQGVELLTMEDAEHVYLCVRPPAGSLGTLDVYLRTAKDAALINLHVSAQVGERTRQAQGWPDYVWRNNEGWYGAPVPFAAVEVGQDGRPSAQFAPDTARELALEKSRFGPGVWRIRFEVRALGPLRDRMTRFPSDAALDDVETWATMRVG